MRKRLLKLELRKALRNPFFWIALLLGCGLATLSSLYRIELNQDDLAQHLQVQQSTGISYNPITSGWSLYGSWIGVENYTTACRMFYMLFPLLIAIPYGWSYCAERNSGYERSMVLRAGARPYYAAKYVAVFVSGGLAMVLPELYNLALNAMFMPAYMPDPSFNQYSGVFPHHLFSTLFYTAPGLYIALHLLLHFVFCGLLACGSYALSVFIKSRVAVVVLPFLLFVGLSWLPMLFPQFDRRNVPASFLQPVANIAGPDPVVLVVEAVALFALTYLLTVTRGRKHEIY